MKILKLKPLLIFDGQRLGNLNKGVRKKKEKGHKWLTCFFREKVKIFVFLKNYDTIFQYYT